MNEHTPTEKYQLVNYRDLEALSQRLVKALRLLYDHQNGCPLPKYTKDWMHAMDLSKSVLADYDTAKIDASNLNKSAATTAQP